MAVSEGRVVVLAALPMLFGAVWLVGLRRPEATNEPTRAHAVASQAVAVSSVERDEGGWLGVIVAGYSTDVAAEVSGSVNDVWVTVGAHVKAAAQLLRIDASATGGDLRAARAKLEQQRSAVAGAAADLAEASDLVTRLRSIEGGVPARTLLAARTREQQAEAALREAEAGIGVHEADIGQQVTRNQKYIVRAPFDGIVVERFVDPGALVAPGQVVARIITEDCYVRFAMPPAAARARAVGDTVQVALEDRVVPATLSDMQPEVDSSSQLVFARAKLEAGAGVLPIPGARVRVRPLPNAAPVRAPGAPAAALPGAAPTKGR